MNLLRLIRVIQDEGLIGALRYAKNSLSNSDARKHVFAMRIAFNQYKQNLSAIYLVAAGKLIKHFSKNTQLKFARDSKEL